MEGRNIQIAVIGTQRLHTDERAIYFFDHLLPGYYDEENKKFVSIDGQEFRDILDNRCFYDDNEFYAIDYLDSNISGKELIDILESNDKNFSQIFVDVENSCNDLIYVADFKGKDKDCVVRSFKLDFFDDLLEQEVEQEKVDNALKTIDDSEMKFNLASIYNLDLPSLDDATTWDDKKINNVRDKALKLYDDRSFLSDFIKGKLGKNDNIKAYDDFLINRKSVQTLITALKSEKVTFDELDDYFELCNSQLLILDDYLFELDELINYRNPISKIKKSENIIKELKKTIISQDDAIDRIVTELDLISLIDDPSEKDGILITGSTGVGKTLLIKTIAKLLEKDVCIIDSSQLVINGYKGTQISDALEQCYFDVDEDVDRLENAIIYFDEIDKKGLSSGSDVSGKGVLDSLLKFLDGTTYTLEVGSGMMKEIIPVSTNKMIVIAGGSFSSVYEYKPSNSIGFNASVGKNENYIPTDEDFIRIGRMTREFMGRFPTVIHLNDLKKDDYKKILVESDISPLKLQQKYFGKLGVNLLYDDEYLDAVGELTEKSAKGARGLKGAVKNTTRRAFSDIRTDFEDVEEIRLTRATVEDNTNYEIVRKGKIKKLSKK